MFAKTIGRLNRYEESLIGVIQQSKAPTPIPQQAEAQQSVPQGAEAVQPRSGNTEYRKKLIKRAMKLKKEGMSDKKMADTFNDEKVPTVSGAGKWYSSSINNLLNPKK